MDFFNYDFNISDIAFACRVPSGKGDRVHNDRPSHGLAFNVSGEKIYNFSDGQAHTLKANEIIFLPRHSDYTVDDIIPGECYAVNFMLSEEADFLPFVWHAKNPDKIYSVFRSLEKAFRTKTPGYKIQCKANVYSLLYACISDHSRAYAPSSYLNTLSPAISYIHSNYFKQSISVEHLAALCRVNSSYFRRIFSAEFGTSPIKYINALRLSRAKELLSQTNYDICSVSEYSGFGNQYYFLRFFKSETGLTPSAWRKDNNPNKAL